MIAPAVRLQRSVTIGDATFQEVCVSEGASTPWHDHETAYLDLYLSGAARVSWQDELHVYSLSVIPPGMSHKSVTLTDTHTFQVIVQNPPPLLRHAVFENSRPRHIAQELFNAFSANDDLIGMELEGLLADLWVACGVQRPRKRNPEKCGWLLRVEDLLRASYLKPPTPADIAKEAAIDPAHMMREFKRAHRCTMGQFVRSVRIEKACHIMKRQTLSLSEVAHEIGFADQSHFNRSFKRCMGVTPSEFQSVFRGLAR